jgi:hypothetical protein
MTQHKKELQNILAAASHFTPPGAFIAGGALTSSFTGNDIKDVDIYFKSKEDFIAAVEQAYDEGMWCVAATDRAVTFTCYNNIIRLMHFDFFKTAEEIFDAFDFTVCMAAYDLDTKEFIFHEDFLKHAAQRFLRFHSGTRYPYGSLMRVVKYQQRGYTIGKSDLLRIGLSCQRVAINSWDDLASAIGGQYGDKAKIETDVPYSLEAADDMFKDTEFVLKEKENMPGTAEELLEKIGVVYDNSSI